LKCDAASNYLFVNGELSSKPDAKLFSRISGDSVYEVIKLLGGIPLFLEDHMDRLDRSIRLRGEIMSIPIRRVKNEINSLVKKTGCSNINVKLVWYPATEKAMFLTYFIQQDIPTKEEYRRGVHTILFSGARKNPHVKAIKTSYRERAATARESAGAFEALLVDDNGFVSEGTRSNIFYLIDGQLFTPPSDSVLLGVTRQHVIAICRELGIIVKEQKLNRKDIKRLEGAFITGTSIDVLPIGSIDNETLASAVHPIIKTIAQAFDKHVTKYVKKHSLNQRSLL